MMIEVNYSVVVPVYNGALSLEELFEGIREVFLREEAAFEVIFVDDRSPDDSWQVIVSLKERYPDQVKGIRLSKNFGQHNATFCGLNYATGELVITIDDDLQTPPQEIARLLSNYRTSQADLVYGFYGNKRHAPLRNLGSRSLKQGARVLHDSPGEGSSFRLLTAGLVNKIRHHQPHFIFLDEVLLWYTDDISFAEVAHLPRKYKQSGYSFGKLLSLFANVVLYYTMLPLKFLVYGGFILSLFTFVFGLYFIGKKIMFNVPLGYTSLIVTVLFSTSIILFSLGVLGEYLSRIYQVQNRKPPYSIKRMI